MRKNTKKPYLIGFVICLITGLGIFFVEQRIENNFQQEIKDSLVSLVKTTKTSINHISDNNKNTIDSTVILPSIIQSVSEITGAPKTNSDESIQSAKMNVDKIANNIISKHNFRHYYLITPFSNEIITSSNVNPVEINFLSDKYPYFFNRLWQGETLSTYPHSPTFYEKNITSSQANKLATMILGAVIRDTNDKIIAALLFSLDTDIEYGDILLNAQIGQTGETYLLDYNGLFISSSRFNQLSRFNKTINLSDFINPTEIDFQKEYLTINIEGYQDYRNATVIGAWLWEPKQRLYIVTEIEKSQSFSSIHQLRQAAFFSFSILCISTFLFIFFFERYKNKLNKNKERLQHSQLRLRLAFENIPSGNIVSDWDGIIEEFSKSAETILGYSSAEMIGKNITIIMPEPYRSNHANSIKQFLHTGEEKIIGSGGRDLYAVHKDGHQVPIHICLGTMVVDHQLHFIASITDRTLESKMEKQLYNFQKMKAVGQLASGLAHDFNNLLGIAMGNLQLLQHKATLNEDSTKKINTSLQALQRGATLTSQLLNFTRIDDSSTVSININESILSIKNLLEQTATNKVNIQYSLEDDLGVIEANYGDFGDALINLTANARDAMPDGGKLLIETSSCTSNVFLTPDFGSKPIEYLMLAISDTGEGISADKLERIFEPFYTTKARNKGTGLGLAMVSSFVKNSHAEMRVYSEVGIGTTFKLFFPKIITTIETKQPKSETSIRGGKETILLVDDELDLLEIAETNLEDAGYNVLTASSGDAAYEIIKTHNIDFVLSDIVMPGQLNGFELLIKSLTLKPLLKSALTSGFTAKAGEKLIEGSLLAKYLASTLLPKPYSHQDLLSFIRKHLDRKIIVTWNKDLLIGIEALDDDHLVLTHLINSLQSSVSEGADIKDLIEITSDLIDYNAMHFHREEIVMKTCNFPDYESHVSHHLDLTREVEELLQQLKSSDNEKIKISILNNIINWLVKHISEDDQLIAKYAKGHFNEIHDALKADMEQTNDS